MRKRYTSRQNGSTSTRLDNSQNASKRSNDIPLWRSPIVAIAGLAGIVILVAITFIELTAQPVISVQANDVSDSARAYSKLSKNACKARNSQLKPGDVQIDIIYADAPELRRNTEVNNTLSLIRQCSNLFDENGQQPESGIRKSPGTSPESAIDQIDTQVSSKRAEGINFPAVILITLHENEPVPGQPTSDIGRIKDKISNLTRDNQGVIVISGPTGQLQTKLATALKDNPNARICTFDDIKSCTQWAFQKGRRLHIE